MQNAFFKRMAAAIVASVTALALVIQPLAAAAYSESDAWSDFAANFNNQAQTQPVTPYTPPVNSTSNNLSEVAVSTTKYNPATQGSLAISFTVVNPVSSLYVAIKDMNDTTIATLDNTGATAAGAKSYIWNGASAANQLYKVQVKAPGLSGAIEIKEKLFFVIPSSNIDPNLFNINASPKNINAGQSTSITFDVAAPSTIWVEVDPSGSSTPVRTYSFSGTTGTNTWNWDGRDNNGQQVVNGSYVVSVSTFNTFQPKGETMPITVTVGNGTTSCGINGMPACPTSGTLILNPSVTPSTYSPLKGLLQVNYFILGQAYVTVAIFQGDYMVAQLKTNTLESNANTAVWDGKYLANGLQNGAYVQSGTYKYRITANYGTLTDSQEGLFTVNTGSFNGQELCAGFKDVSVDSMYCNAIVEMQKQGIFVGYADGTFRAGAAINRAETVKVVMLALKYNVPLTGWYFDSAGFKDVYSGAWYTPYLAAARLYKVINGYPDKTFKPAQTVNRAELSKIFLEASNIAQLGVPCIDQPYKDHTKATWFGKYACLDKYFSLVDDIDGKFAGATAMTRGDVALMIYRAQVQNLLKNLPPKAAINFNLIQTNQFPYKAF